MSFYSPFQPQSESTPAPIRNVLVTGAGGYLGSRMLNRLAGYISPENRPVTTYGISRRSVEETYGAHVFTGDLLTCDFPRLLEEVQPDVVFHFAAASPTASFEAHQRDTLEATRYVLQTLYEIQPLARVILPGTYLEYGETEGCLDESLLPQPESEWALFKHMQLHLGRVFAKQLGLTVILPRLFECYGETPWNPWIGEIARQIALEEKRFEAYPKLRPRTLKAKRDLTHVDDVLDALLALGEKGRRSEVYHIASGHTTDVQEVVRLLLAQSKLKHFEVIPQSEAPVSTVSGRANKINVHTGWKPKKTLAQGLTQELAYWRNQPLFLSYDDLLNGDNAGQNLPAEKPMATPLEADLF